MLNQGKFTPVDNEATRAMTTLSGPAGLARMFLGDYLDRVHAYRSKRSSGPRPF